MNPSTSLLDTFSNRNCHREHEKSKTSYLPTIPNSREYPVCKTYLHFLVDTIEAPELPYIFLPADEQVCTRVLHIIWKYKDLYSIIIPIMDAFYQIRVFQRVLFKRYSCFRLQDWFVDSGRFATGSVSQAFEGTLLSLSTPT